uniref:Uncharacterized protein AlNc14C82G5338 n=1 Tax=Albugo laibachii Nc14 TaxID=890382 RepID=F0WFE9_9STRA|nr:conserved hypothetical protein [Albugo laibachii Nc14]|eukprot:CCA19931.1 conserved hypothetical protein [Albugo laibachii Nc14]
MINEAQLQFCQNSLRKRLSDEEASFQLLGVEDCMNAVLDLFTRTFTDGESQSGILIGSCKHTKRCILTQSLKRFETLYGEFCKVYLNGMHLQTETEAFKDLLLQLVPDLSKHGHTVAYVKIYDLLKQILHEKAVKKETIIIIIDEMEQFATSKKQLLLYNLVDWAQTKDVRIGLLGVAEHSNMLQLLEVRVQSRFSNIQIIVPRPRFSQVLAFMEQSLTLDKSVLASFEDEVAERLKMDAKTGSLWPPDSYLEEYQRRLDVLVNKSESFRELIQLEYDCGETAGYFLQLALLAVGELQVPVSENSDEHFLSAEIFQQVKNRLAVDYQLSILQGLADASIAILVTMAILNTTGQEYFTLEMVYTKWQQFHRKHDIMIQMPTRGEVRTICEYLEQLQLVRDAGDAFGLSRAKMARPNDLPPRYRAMYLNFSSSLLLDQIRTGSVSCSTRTREWALNPDNHD